MLIMHYAIHSSRSDFQKQSFDFSYSRYAIYFYWLMVSVCLRYVGLKVNSVVLMSMCEVSNVCSTLVCWYECNVNL